MKNNTFKILDFLRPYKRVIYILLEVFWLFLTFWLLDLARIRLSQEATFMLCIAVGISLILLDYKSALLYRDHNYFVNILLRCSFISLCLLGFWYTSNELLSKLQAFSFLLTYFSVQFVSNLIVFVQYSKLYKDKKRKNVLIYGAGEAGVQIGRAIALSKDKRLVGYIDDNKEKVGQRISGVQIFNYKDVNHLVSKLNVQTVFVTMPSADSKIIEEKISNLKSLNNVEILILPKVFATQPNVNITDLYSADINELLGRQEVPPKPELLRRDIKDKTVLVTGAGGSIGSEICRQVSKGKARSLIMVESSEHALYQILKELQSDITAIDSAVPKRNLVIKLGSVLDESFLSDIFKEYKIDTVYHAAAYKHVPIVEDNIISGLKNNIFGTYNIAKLSNIFKVSKFVLISTDKAVRPTNVMGASKRFAEIVIQFFAFNMSKETIYTMVRFGNVLGSSGSVVPLFQEQIRKGGPITLTHKEVTRYFMTIPESASLVIQAGALSKGGEVFLLDMGDSVKIYDLASKMIEQSGNKIRKTINETGIAIEVTGLRPGEKLYEELLIDSTATLTEHERILKANEPHCSKVEFLDMLGDLQQAIKDLDESRALAILEKSVKGFKLNRNIGKNDGNGYE